MRRALGGSRAALASLLALGVGPAPLIVGCRELDRFSTNGDHFEGTIVAADFVRTGIAAGTTLCLTLDADRLESGPGAFSTSDGAFSQAALRPIPQLLNDPLSMYTFADGQIKNLIYAAHASPPDGGPGTAADPLIFLSLLQSNDVELRVVRSAPELGGGDASPGASVPVFALFPLTRKPGPCTY